MWRLHTLCLINVFKKKSSFPYILHSCALLAITLSIKDVFVAAAIIYWKFTFQIQKLFRFPTFYDFVYLGFIFYLF
jgi:hypothetical protein